MAFPFPADKVRLPAASSAAEEVPRKSKSRRARRAAKAEARLFQSYTMVEMDDVEDDKEDSQSFKKPKTRRGDSTWRKLSEVDLRQE